MQPYTFFSVNNTFQIPDVDIRANYPVCSVKFQTPHKTIEVSCITSRIIVEMNKNLFPQNNLKPASVQFCRGLPNANEKSDLTICSPVLSLNAHELLTRANAEIAYNRLNHPKQFNVQTLQVTSNGKTTYHEVQ